MLGSRLALLHTLERLAEGTHPLCKSMKTSRGLLVCPCTIYRYQNKSPPKCIYGEDEYVCIGNVNAEMDNDINY